MISTAYCPSTIVSKKLLSSSALSTIFWSDCGSFSRAGSLSLKLELFDLAGEAGLASSAGFSSDFPHQGIVITDANNCHEIRRYLVLCRASFVFSEGDRVMWRQTDGAMTLGRDRLLKLQIHPRYYRPDTCNPRHCQIPKSARPSTISFASTQLTPTELLFNKPVAVL
mgnify:CR=1 FL=1